MHKTWLIFALISIVLGTVSCSKSEDEKYVEEETGFVGKWIATSGKYNLIMKITAIRYSFSINEPGNGGVIDEGTYEVSNAGIISFTSDQGALLANGYIRNGKLSLTFVNSAAIMMLGIQAAGNTTFTLSEEEDDNNTGGNDDYGFLVIQNLSVNYNIVAFKFYDGKGNYLDSDSDVLAPGYQFAYETQTGNYIVEITDNRNKSFRSKSFTVIKDKSTVLAFDGSALNILATGMDNSGLSRATTNPMALKSIPTLRNTGRSQIE